MGSEPKSDQIQPESVRPASQAGRFYPAEPEELRSLIEELIRPADGGLRALIPPTERVQTSQMPIAILTPHAGYAYSGATAGAAFAEVRSGAYDHVLVLAPSHFCDFHGVGLPAAGYFETPLGRVVLDIPALRELLDNDLFNINEEAHRPEHAIEVELPFLQTALSQKFQILPLLLARLQNEELFTLAERLNQFLTGRRRAGEQWLIVASSDTYHGYNLRDCIANDQKLLALLKNGNSKDFLEAIRQQKVMACGWAPLAITMELASRAGPPNWLPLARNDSSGGKRDYAGYMVGYIGAAFFA